MVYKIDVDGVLRDMATVMVRLYNERYFQEMSVDEIVDFRIPVSFPLYGQDFTDPYDFLFVRHAEDTLYNAPVYDGASEAMKAIASDPDNRIIIVSHQPTLNAKILTMKWLERNGMSYNDICFTNMQDKTFVDCDVIIDDYGKHLDAEKEDVVRACINRPYNRDGNYDFRFDSIYDLSRNLPQLKKRRDDKIAASSLFETDGYQMM